jgi:hypothetical protein
MCRPGNSGRSSEFSIAVAQCSADAGVLSPGGVEWDATGGGGGVGWVYLFTLLTLSTTTEEVPNHQFNEH